MAAAADAAGTLLQRAAHTIGLSTWQVCMVLDLVLGGDMDRFQKRFQTTPPTDEQLRFVAAQAGASASPPAPSARRISTRRRRS